MWLYPNFDKVWKLYFGIKTSRKSSDHIDILIPEKHRSLNLPIVVKVGVSKDFEKNNYTLTTIINGEFVSSTVVPAKITVLRNRNLYVKCPWGTDLNGYVVNSVVFKAPTPPTDEERKLHKSIESNKKVFTDKIEDIEKEF